MFYLYMLPYTILYGLLGVIGSLLAVIVVGMGVLRCAVLLFFLLTGDTARFKSELTEGFDGVWAKIKAGWQKVKKWCNNFDSKFS